MFEIGEIVQLVNERHPFFGRLAEVLSVDDQQWYRVKLNDESTLSVYASDLVSGWSKYMLLGWG